MDIKELCLLLKTSTSVSEIDSHRNDIAELLPEVKIMFEYDQGNYAHQYDLWMHSLHTVIGIPRGLPDDMLYLAALLHDIGKPSSRCRSGRENDENWHYYGHPEKSYQIVRENIMPKIRNDITENEARRLLYYVKNHDYHMSLRIKHLRRHLQSASLEEFKHLMLLEVADAKAHVMFHKVRRRVVVCSQWSGQYADEMYDRIIQDKKGK